MTASQATPDPATVTTLENSVEHAITAALVDLGSNLREARRGRGLELAQLAAQLRMGEEQLQALEEADLQRLPEMVFVIAQARRVASCLGVDIDPLVAPLKQGGFTIKPAPAPLTAVEDHSERRPNRLTASQYTEAKASARQRRGNPLKRLAGLALLAGVISGGAWGWQQRQRLPNEVAWLQGQLQTLTGRAPAVPKASPKPTAKPTSKTTAKSALKPAVNPALAPTSLTLSSPQPSWIEVRSLVGNKQLFEGNLSGRRVFPLGQGLRVLAGRPDLVQASLGTAAAKPLGPIDQINWLTFKPPTKAAAAKPAAPTRPAPAP
ncbi:MAG: hypothetical protein RLZZ533_1363 [Cyanobacteriota bacterium]